MDALEDVAHVDELVVEGVQFVRIGRIRIRFELLCFHDVDGFPKIGNGPTRGASRPVRTEYEESPKKS